VPQTVCDPVSQTVSDTVSQTVSDPISQTVCDPELDPRAGRALAKALRNLGKPPRPPRRESRMQNLLIAASIAVAFFQAPTRPPIVRSESVLVRYVFDGDTIDVVTVGRVRLLGIDAPETGRGLETPAPFAAEARARLEALVLRRWVRLEYEGPRTDKYNRRLAYVFTEDGQFVNEVLLREGLARVSAREPLARLRELQRAQAQAQAYRRGMWGRAPASARSCGDVTRHSGLIYSLHDGPRRSAGSTRTQSPPHAGACQTSAS